MSHKLALAIDPNYQGDGTVLRSKGQGWIRPTGVFVPENGITHSHEEVRILLWFHGHFVKNIDHLFYHEATNLLQAVNYAKRDIILVAPELGWFQDSDHTDYNARVLGGKCAQYLDQVLGALTDWFVDTFIAGEIASMNGNFPKFQLGDLYVAGHSGGGGGITSAVAALGSHRDSLRECWGFDCLYGSGQSWYEWARAQKGIPLYFYYGRGTQPAANADVLGFWKRAYGTPRGPLPAGARMKNVYLAPGLPGTELDMVAFQSAEDIKAKGKAGNRYEEVRLKVDPLLDNPGQYWKTLLDEGLKGHYPVVSDLLGPRIKQSVP